VFIFISNKANEDEKPARSWESVSIASPSVDNMPEKGSHYVHTKEVVGNRLPFLYIYATTYNIVTHSVDQAIFMGEKDTLAMLGPFAELCRVGPCQS
jgi:hypothetical protein